MLENIQTFREAFAKEVGKPVDLRNASLLFIYKDASTLRHKCSVGDYCHGALTSASLVGYTSGFKPEYIGSWINPPVTDKQLHLDYQNWLINDSPWKDVFLEKSLYKAIKFGHVVDVNQPWDLVGSAMVASRFTTENYQHYPTYKNRYEVYTTLLKTGHSIKEALFFTYLLGRNSSGIFPMVVSPIQGGHTIFDLKGCDATLFSNFMNGDYTKGRPSFKTNMGYSVGISDTFSGPITTFRNFVEEVRELTPKSRSVKKSFSVFAEAAKRRSEGFQLKDEEDLVDMVKQIKERFL